MDASFVRFVVDQLAGLGGVRSRRMFGAAGLYADDVFFAIVHEGRVYFKTDDDTVTRYEARGMGPFRPTDSQTLKRYRQVPGEVVEDADALVEWGREAVRAARSS